MKVYQKLAQTLQAYRNCLDSGNEEWVYKHFDTICSIEKNNLPSGSGFDTGTKIEIDDCNESLIVLWVDYHHMDENGSYCGWSEHRVKVSPTFDGIRIKTTCTSDETDDCLGVDDHFADFIQSEFRDCLEAEYKQ
jgi:hypothetical protein